jgi:hypothetical protein
LCAKLIHQTAITVICRMSRTPGCNTLAREPIERIGIIRAIRIVAQASRQRSGLWSGRVNSKSKMKGRARDPPMSIRLGSRQRWRKGWKLRPRHCVPSYLDRWRGRRNCSSLEDRGRSQDRFLAWRGSRSRIRSHNCLLRVRKCTWQRQRGAQVRHR